jgi:hypothetical protein
MCNVYKTKKELRYLKNFGLTEALFRVRRIICEYYYKIIILPLGLVYAIFCQVILKVKLLKIGVLFLNDQAWQRLVSQVSKHWGSTFT